MPKSFDRLDLLYQVSDVATGLVLPILSHRGIRPMLPPPEIHRPLRHVKYFLTQGIADQLRDESEREACSGILHAAMNLFDEFKYCQRGKCELEAQNVQQITGETFRAEVSRELGFIEKERRNKGDKRLLYHASMEIANSNLATAFYNECSSRARGMMRFYSTLYAEAKIPATDEVAFFLSRFESDGLRDIEDKWLGRQRER